MQMANRAPPAAAGESAPGVHVDRDDVPFTVTAMPTTPSKAPSKAQGGKVVNHGPAVELAVLAALTVLLTLLATTLEVVTATLRDSNQTLYALKATIWSLCTSVKSSRADGPGAAFPLGCSNLTAGLCATDANPVVYLVRAANITLVIVSLYMTVYAVARRLGVCRRFALLKRLYKHHRRHCVIVAGVCCFLAVLGTAAALPVYFMSCLGAQKTMGPGTIVQLVTLLPAMGMVAVALYYRTPFDYQRMATDMELRAREMQETMSQESRRNSQPDDFADVAMVAIQEARRKSLGRRAGSMDASFNSASDTRPPTEAATA
jgi:hypothetical protein